MKYRRRLKYYLLKLFRLHDSPKAVAGGFAWGTITHFHPFFGFGPLLAVGLAGMFRTNMMAATVAWALTLPLFPLLFYFNILMGDLIVGVQTENIFSVIQGMSHIKMHQIILLGKAFIIGSIVNSVVAVIFIWWWGTVMFKRYRKRALCYIRRVL